MIFALFVPNLVPLSLLAWLYQKIAHIRRTIHCNHPTGHDGKFHLGHVTDSVSQIKNNGSCRSKTAVWTSWNHFEANKLIERRRVHLIWLSPCCRHVFPILFLLFCVQNYYHRRKCLLMCLTIAMWCKINAECCYLFDNHCRFRQGTQQNNLAKPYAPDSPFIHKPVRSRFRTIGYRKSFTSIQNFAEPKKAR